MPTELILPKVDMDMATGKIARWLVAEGDRVTKGQVVFEMETDKAAMEVEAPASGILARVTGAGGVDIPVGHAVAWIYADGEAMEAAPAVDVRPAPKPVSTPSSTSVPHAPADIDAGEAGGVRATPLARRLARELDIDLADVSGGGPKGRVTAEDIRDFQPSGPDHARQRTGSPVATWLRQAPGPDPIVLLHGFGSETASWRPLLTAFPRQAPILSIDLPGHGAAVDIRADGFEDLVVHVEQTLIELGVRTAHLVGHSLGGAVAIAVAAGLAVEARSLMLIAPAGLGPEINTGFTQAFAAARDLGSLRLAMAELMADPSALSEGLVRATAQTRKDGRLAEAQAPLGERLFGGGAQRLSVRSQLETLAMPIKLVAGREDRVIPPAHALGLPGQVGVHLFDKVGHMPQWEARDAVAKLLDELFRSS